MTNQNKQAIMQAARGHWQKTIVYGLMQGSISNPISSLQGKAKSYSGRYQASFNNLIARIRQSGVIVQVQKGKRGGMYGATYTVQ